MAHKNIEYQIPTDYINFKNVIKEEKYNE